MAILVRLLVAGTVAVAAAVALQTTRLSGQAPPPLPDYCRSAQAPDLPLPSALAPADYETALYDFLFARAYRRMDWCVDRAVRDTGPFLLDSNYGTHPAVRIYYSPGVMEWLRTGRDGTIPDGAMIVKEMFPPPAARYEELRAQLASRLDGAADAEAQFEAALDGMLEAWTVLVKDRRVSKDGWFWANPAPGSAPDGYGAPFDFPASGAGLGTCLRCHASAAAESTFASLANIRGFEQMGDPLRFRVDESWRTDLPDPERPAGGRSEANLIAALFQHLPESHRPPETVTSPALTEPNRAFLSMFPPVRRTADGAVRLLPPAADQVQAFPGQWADRVPAAPDGAEQFITSDNCLGCHGGLGGAPAGVAMFLQTGPGYGDGFNVSEFGEWRWSPMGLAGRDPIFYAQLESELALLARDAAGGLFPAAALRTYQQAVVNTCLSCHGAMGQRQLAIDARAPGGPDGVDDPNFYYPDYIDLVTPLTAADAQRQAATVVDGIDGAHSVAPYHRYANLARDGISCTVCHHIDPPAQWTDDMPRNERLAAFLLHSTTGVFPYSPPDVLNGPFPDVRTAPMEQALGIEPRENPYIRDSKMCGTCHTINLPNVDAPTDRPLQGLDPEAQAVLNQAARNGAAGPDAVPLADRLVGFQHSIEQATYLEWENSDFAWDPATTRSCQDCHMPGGFRSLDGAIDIPQIATQIATIQDSTYPEAEHDLPDAEIEIPVRDDYRRHELVGLNVFLVEMFNQFDRFLGVDQSDFMTGATNGDALAIENMVRQAREETVALHVEITSAVQGALEATVTVTNKVGHRLPSGVGFRRVFLELLVSRETGGRPEVVWGSGRTNAVGVIVDGQGVPLATEFLDQGGRTPPAQCAGLGYDTVPLYQEHHDVITRQDQVQIYEELVLDASGRFTTSFIHRDCHPKDNRLTPFGTIDPETQPEAFRERFGDDETIAAFMRATVPEGAAADDASFRPGQDTLTYRITLPQGLDLAGLTVTATMYSQAIPPAWLRDRFDLGATLPAGQRPATERLYYLASHLDTAGTPIADWKLPLVSATARVVRP